MFVTRPRLSRPRPMSALEAMAGGPWLFAAVGLLGLALTAGHVAVARLLAVLYPPGVVVAVGVVALGGVGVGAALAHGAGRWLEPARLPVAGALGAGGLVAALTLALPLVSNATPPALAAGALAVLAAAIGLAIAASLAAVDRRTGRLVGVWLAASALGAPAGLGLLAILPPPDALPIIAAVLAGAAVCAAQSAGAWPRPAAGLLIVTGLLALGNLALPWPSLSPEAIGPSGDGLGAVLRRGGAGVRLEQTRWDGAGRLDVVAVGGGRRLAFADGWPVTTEGPVDLTPLAPPPRERVLTIGPVGPAAAALAALEDLAPRLAPLDTTVHASVAGDGRAWVRQGRFSYDLIWLSRPGRSTLPPVGLTEAGNPEITVEAIDDYLGYLAPDGLLVVRLPHQSALYRAALTAISALERRGYPSAEAANHVILVDGAGLLLAVRTTAYGADESMVVRNRLEAAGWRPLYVPHALVDGPVGDLARGQAIYRVAGSLPGLTLVPPIDQAPFFATFDRDWPTSVWLPLVLTLVLLLGAFAYLAWTTEPDHYGLWRAVPYAVAAGIGGVLLTHALIQRLTVWLEGNLPATVVVTVALGGWAAAGAWASDRATLTRWPVVGLWAGLFLAAWTALEAFGILMPVDRLSLPPLAGRIVMIGVLLAPPGVALGLPMPLLLRAAQRLYAGRPVALLWSIHGLAGAFGLAGAIALALRFGLTANLLVAAGLCAGLALLARPVLAR